MSTRFLALLCLTAPVSADVLYVDASGNGDFTDLPQAVAAAQDGDVLLVRSGAYSGFAIVDKDLAVLADAGAAVSVAGTVVVTGLAERREVTLAGLEVTGPQQTAKSDPGLLVQGCVGQVRVEDCLLRGGIGLEAFPGGPGEGGAGAEVVASGGVSFAGTALTGGRGFQSGPFVLTPAGDGGEGLLASGSPVWVFDCTLTGGAGGTQAGNGGDGGPGLSVTSFGVFVSGSTLKGGKGGNADDFICPVFGGDGGDGLVVGAGAQAQVVDSQLFGGAPGVAPVCNTTGQAGVGQSGPGTFIQHPGAARSLSAPTLAATSASITLQYEGADGDQVWLLAAGRAGKQLFTGTGVVGSWLLQQPIQVTKQPDLVLSGTSAGALTVGTSALSAGVGSASRHYQWLVKDSGGGLRLSGPRTVRLLDCASLLPDCDGNGALDTCDLLAGAVDCDADGVPDVCEPDCNANGVADDCDIASGSSPDLNGNGVPDECEPAGVTWFVDAGAPPGGNGSAGAPFQDLTQAFAAALTGHAVVLADGVYSGPANRDLLFNGREFTVRSANGPAGCILDLQSAGRAFEARHGEQNLRFEGLTFRSGSSTSGGAIYLHPAGGVVVDCVFEQCAASFEGGAVMANSGSPLLLIRGSRFTQCSAGNGGAVRSGFNVIRLDDCVFEACSVTNVGGAVTLFLGGGLNQVSRCVFRGNQAGLHGGALYASGFTTDVLGVVDCLFEGNAAPVGGAVAGNGILELRCSTLVGNSASSKGGGVARTAGGTGSVVDCILWDNAAPAGAQIALVAQPTPGSLSVAYSDVQGGQAAVLLEGASTLQWLAGNLDVDPLFVAPLSGDYRLDAGSPCLDAGDNGAVPADLNDVDGDGDTSEPVPFDLDGGPRFVDDPAPDTGVGTPPLVDLGAYER